VDLRRIYDKPANASVVRIVAVPPGELTTWP
jgi:hypothetical protein